MINYLKTQRKIIMNDSSEKKRLSKFMAAAGVASRRAAEELIFAGKVKVNGVVVKLPQTLVNEKDKILVNDEPIHLEASKVYFILNKPAGYICTNLKTKSTKIVLDLFAGVKERLFTVGRLDKDTTGLLIVTNDGHFANRVIHPSKNIHKEYLVKTDHELSHDHLVAISNGTLVEGTLKVVISEGKKREIRMIMEAAGLQVMELTRIRIGSLTLGPLEVGKWRAMSEKEKELIFN